MASALILYHSLFGNTKEVAFSLARGIEESGVKTDCKSIDSVDLQSIYSYNFLAIGGPTHMVGISKPMKEFLGKIKSFDLRKMKGFCFDTRVPSRLNQKKWLILENSAAKRIEGKMRKMKIKIIKPRQSAIVTGREGPLDNGVEKMFLDFGKEIGGILCS
ncbi:MAG: flavodoxin domain-containing protein [Candidatus Hodarchaeales archaeon]|jgi:flavodoxin